MQKSRGQAHAGKADGAGPAGRGRRGTGAQSRRAAAPADDLRALARDAALAALKRLSDLSRSEDERVALAATQELLNRAFGKAAAAGAEESGATRPLIIKIVKFGDTGLPAIPGDKPS